MGLSDNQQPVNVTLKLDDWATIIAAMAFADVPAEERLRINSEIFRCAQATKRVEFV